MSTAGDAPSGGPPVVDSLSDELQIRDPVPQGAIVPAAETVDVPLDANRLVNPAPAPPLHHPLSPSASPHIKQARTPRVSLSYPERLDRPSRNENTSAVPNAATAIEEAPVSRKSSQHRARRSQSLDRGRKSRSSLDAAGAALRRSLSVVRKSESGPVDPMQEPRRSIGKRPDELHLKERDPHLANSEWWKHARRAVPFAAPYERSGVVIDQPATLKDWIVPGPLTFGHGQWWYLVFGQSLIAAIISGSINFGIAVALYLNADTIDIWTFDRQTVAGDMGVTVIIQQIVSFIITSSLVHHDLYAGPVGPLRRPWPPLLHLPSTPDSSGHTFGSKMAQDVKHEGVPCPMGRSEGKSKLNGYWWWFVRAVCTGSERNDLLARGISWRQRFERLVWTAAQGFFLCVLTFWWYWPLAIAIVAPIYGGRELRGTWIPMIIKLLFGAVLSLLTNPIMALMAMGAESSVRRCYPELPIWYPFGGQADFEQWKVEHGVGVNGVGEEATAPRHNAAGLDDAADVEMRDATNVGRRASMEGTQDRMVAQTTLQGSGPIARRITEEPATLLTNDETRND